MDAIQEACDFERNDEVYDAIEDNEKDIEDGLKGGSPIRATGQQGQTLDLDVERKDRSKEEMAEEASTLAKLFL
eukprot:CAMPEP_0117682282 /NCGR_PEP_ID=MMETSP0804-20121206/19553_1 /TAXON_ID=1074897 /ORGANISM="Tetraselmis astigmatica, Strain CCMP880" /LENGTH=73 /DNA_ID=CAMNT_0005492337 /DNA_START=41 /DNA_END=266 /DNA_ORIENTATION=+